MLWVGIDTRRGSFDLPPGKYEIKFVLRENETGRMGSFIADVTLPDLKKAPLKMSSIVLASQREPSKKDDPLVRNGEEYVPNISHVFRQDQHMYLLYEIYDPARERPAENQPKGAKPATKTNSNIYLRGAFHCGGEMMSTSTTVYWTIIIVAITAVAVSSAGCTSQTTQSPTPGVPAGFFVIYRQECWGGNGLSERLAIFTGNYGSGSSHAPEMMPFRSRFKLLPLNRGKNPGQTFARA